MPVYRLSHKDYLKVRDDPLYGFLADNAKEDHGEFMTITMNHLTMPMISERHGIAYEAHDVVHHFTPEGEV